MKLSIEKVLEAQARTGKTLAQLGLPRTTLQNIRKGANVRPQTVYRFASALGVDVSDIIEGGEAN